MFGGVGKETVEASMGPRSDDRGNVPLPGLVTRRLAELQWGRDRMIAEMPVMLSALAALNKLQWGRDRMIAEILREWNAPAPRLRLQWGRDRMIAEMNSFAAR